MVTDMADAAPGLTTGPATDAAGDTATVLTRARRARHIAERVPDPELPMLTLADLGVLRDVRVEADGTVVASLTPTYSGCPAMAEMRADVAARLREGGFERVAIRTVLDPPWTTDWITEAGRRKLTEHGIAPPGAAPRHPAGPVPLVLAPTRRTVPCPRCGSADTEETSRFAATSCKALWRCRACHEPFEYVKEI
ncbi:1,2-phenylacetyl-CoA epoxidase subunit PaaD [Streptomyces sp. NPDC059477]|uniref:1,2-phenylacetyl-CoA epoxidase subunit PaaD n=1 Tax=Streptomyces sp. NPDC059477 TaxID=3346847 RepID=UPI00368DD544